MHTDPITVHVDRFRDHARTDATSAIERALGLLVRSDDEGRVTQSVETMNKNQDELFSRLNGLPCAARGERIATLESKVENHEKRLTDLEH